MKVPMAKDFNRALKHFLAFSDNFLILLEKEIDHCKTQIIRQVEYNETYPQREPMVPTYYNSCIEKYEKLKDYYSFMRDVANEEYRPSAYSIVKAEFEELNKKGFANSSSTASPYYGGGIGKGWRGNDEWCKKRGKGKYKKTNIPVQQTPVQDKAETPEEKRKRLKREYLENRAATFVSRHHKPKMKTVESVTNQQFKNVA